KKGFISKVTDFFKSIRNTLLTHIVISRTVLLSLSIFLIFSSVTYGFIHKHNYDTKRANTVSDIDQELKFSQTGAEVKLKEQKRYGDMTVIPLTIVIKFVKKGGFFDAIWFFCSNFMCFICDILFTLCREEKEK
ncbi:hypothetical protein, partial [Brevibacterium casei]|uniref:hypothetical protein n=1 Tax=Brevibacterium casei TaxID=33889 RepID=UPI0013DF892E